MLCYGFVPVPSSVEAPLRRRRNGCVCTHAPALPPKVGRQQRASHAMAAGGRGQMPHSFSPVLHCTPNYHSNLGGYPVPPVVVFSLEEEGSPSRVYCMLWKLCAASPAPRRPSESENSHFHFLGKTLNSSPILCFLLIAEVSF